MRTSVTPEMAALIKEIDQFLERTGMSHARFGKANKNGQLYRELCVGRKLRPETLQRIREFMNEEPPVETEVDYAGKPTN